MCERFVVALSSGAEIDDATSQHVCEELRALGAVEETHRYAEELITTALQCLAELEKDPEVGDTPALRALATVAHAVTARRK